MTIMFSGRVASILEKYKSRKKYLVFKNSVGHIHTIFRPFETLCSGLICIKSIGCVAIMIIWS